ncbi:hypothetical protein V2S66_20220 [Streptomyces sp. V4-01]|uniref:Uncharacterized protein n=2 Tax=Actinacidiphila polyblastidii TaxID=3110430 RepID=A0ABU7PEP5_9ACTN|nr:hypothetical protein [Streptomyces sp. V4-01]
MRRELAALRRDLAALALPGQRDALMSARDVRTAVADALADERERELAEARAFWAEQEARESAGDGFFRGGLTGLPGVADGRDALPDYEVPPVLPYLPRQADSSLQAAFDAGRESLDAAFEGGVEAGVAGAEPAGASGAEAGAQGPETAEATRPAPGAIPHPSGPDFTPAPVVASRDQTADRLADLADARIPLSDVRPGPLGTLDVYVFADGTTLCMTPGHRATALKLCDALDRGEVPFLQGGSAIAGAYALTFSCGEESVYVLADRVVASL